jgi:TRAP-type C4-dicarboxylate transport system permease small subunit
MQWINRILKAVIGLLLAALVTTVTLGVIYRYFLQSSLYWGTEVPNILLVWLVFLGSVVAYYQHSHIAFTVVADALPERLARWNDMLVLGVTLAFFGVLLWQGIELAQQSAGSKSQALRISQAWVYSAVPVSAALILFIAVVRFYGAVKAALAPDAASPPTGGQ